MNADGDDTVINLPRRPHAPGGVPASVVESILSGTGAHAPAPGKEADRRAAARPERERQPPTATPAADAEPEDDVDAEGGDYKAFGMADKQALPSLVVILKDGSECGINYADLASAAPDGSMFLPTAPGYKGNVIRLRVAGESGGFFAIAEGLRLRRGWRMLMRHRTPWISELPPGAAPLRPDDPVIWSITFQPVKGPVPGGR